MKRYCDECKTRLPGKKGHGFVKHGYIVCGRKTIQKTIYTNEGARLMRVPTPAGCWK